jgi:hypothetical protein
MKDVPGGGGCMTVCPRQDADTMLGIEDELNI